MLSEIARNFSLMEKYCNSYIDCTMIKISCFMWIIKHHVINLFLTSFIYIKSFAFVLLCKGVMIFQHTNMAAK